MDPASWKHAKDVIFEALQLPADERDTFVREHCTDPAIRAEILAVLKDAPTSDDFLASLPDTDAAGLRETDELADLGPGTRIGQYVILDRLGRGGMGQVFLASDQELRRKVALKCLLTSRLDSEAERARILNEARAAAAINHLNVATIYHVIEHGDRAFIVMEYVEGESLAARLKRERLPLDRVVSIGSQLAAALTAAHARGVVHGDLKPANIQIALDGTVKVLDFGVARACRSLSPPSDAELAAERAAPRGMVGGGTPSYMSPEQLLGRPLDDRSDIYSLGVVLFEMATGHRPFSASAPFGLIEVHRAHRGGSPRADAVDPGVPRALADLIARTMESDLTRRLQSAVEVLSGLEALKQPLDRREPARRERIGRWLSRLAIGVPVLIAAVGAVGLVTTWGFNLAFGRTGSAARFAAEPWEAYFDWGLRAIRPSLVIMTVLLGIALAAGFMLRLLELIGPIARIAARMRTLGAATALKLGLDDPAVLAQSLVGLGLVAVTAMSWLHSDLIFAWANYIDHAALEKLVPLSRRNATEHGHYRIELDVLMLLFGFGLVRVLRRRRRPQTPAEAGGILLLVGILAVLVLMSEAPYRILYHNEGERIDYDSVRCYIIGKSDDEFLIFCPGSIPPRNRAVRQDDPHLRRLGSFESVFTEISQFSPGS